MSLDPPPHRNGHRDTAADLLKPRTSDDPANDGWRTDRVLKQLAALLNSAPDGQTSTRWETIKHLRVLRLAQNDADGFKDDIPAQYFNAYRIETLSSVAASIGATEIEPVHLDIDWFGRGKDNWWDTADSTKSEERRMTTALVHFLERSLGMDTSPAKLPRNWPWPAEFQLPPQTVRDGMTRAGVLLAQPTTVRFEWVRDAPDSEFIFETDPNPIPKPPPDGTVLTLRIRTPACRTTDFDPI